MVLGVVPLMAIAVIWWGLLVLSWFPYCGVSLSLVHCRVSFCLFCCGSAEVLGSWSTGSGRLGWFFTPGAESASWFFLRLQELGRAGGFGWGLS